MKKRNENILFAFIIEVSLNADEAILDDSENVQIKKSTENSDTVESTKNNNIVLSTENDFMYMTSEFSAHMIIE